MATNEQAARAKVRAAGQVRAAIVGLAAFLLLSPLAASCSLASAEPAGDIVLYQEDFEDGQAQGWVLESGWRVAAEEGNNLLTGEGHCFARYVGDAWSNYHVSFRLRLLQGTIHLNTRFSGGGRYLIGFSEEGTTLSKHVRDAFWHELDTDATAHTLGEWYDVEITADEGRIRVVVDDFPALDYTDPTPILFGSFSFETLDNSVAQIDDIIVYGPVPSFTQQWVRTGGPPGGLGYDVRDWPPDSDVLFVTDALSGAYVSEDGGRTWVPINEGLTTRVGESGDAIPVFSLTVDPNDPNIIWAGMQNVRGIFKSTDRGRTWVEKVNGIDIVEGMTFRGFTVDPRSSDIVYAMAEISSAAWTPDGGPRLGRQFDLTQGAVYKTTDGGDNWQEIWRGDNLARYLWIDPRDPEVLYVSTGIFDREAANADVEAGDPGGVGILKSNDGGATWRVLNEENGLDHLYIGSLFMHPHDPDTLLAGVTGPWCDVTNGCGTYLTTDRGETWTRVVGESSTSVEYCLSDPSIAYSVANHLVHRSDDGGFTWELVAGGHDSPVGWGPPGVWAGVPIDMLCDPENPNRLMVNNYQGGNFESLDGGRTWRDASQGYTGAQMRDLAVDANEPARLYAFGRSGPWLTENGGRSWRGLAFDWVPTTLQTVAVDPANARHLLAAEEWPGTIMASYDGGMSWDEVYHNPRVPEAPGFNDQHGYGTMEFAPSDPDVVYAGIRRESRHFNEELATDSYGMYKSTDRGDTWHEINDARTVDKSIMDVAVHPTSPAIVYAAAYGAGVLKTTDGGERWQGTGALCTNVLALEIDPREPETVYAGCRYDAVYKTTDGGSTWVRSSAGMNPSATVRDIVADPTNRQTIYAATSDSGVFRSEDGGERWEVTNQGLTNRSVYALAISANGETVYAGTDGAGVFRLDVGGEPPPPVATPTSTRTATPTHTPRSTPTPTKTPTSRPTPLGDVNCDAIVNSVDAAVILQYNAGLLASLPCPLAGDANEDGTVNAIDATLILQYNAGLIPDLPPSFAGRR